MKLFNLDSPVMLFLTKVANLMILNIITLLLCIPIVTAGPAITALYYVTIKMAKGDDPYIIQNYFKSFKQNFRQALIIWLIMLAVIVIIAVDLMVLFGGSITGQLATIMKVVICVITVLLLLGGLYIFPVLSRFDNTVKQTIKNSFLMSIMSLPRSILILVIHLLPVLLLLVSMQVLPVLFLLGISAVAYLSSLQFVKIFKRFEPAEEEENTDPDELAPLSFIVEEERLKQEALEAEQRAQQTEQETAAAVEEDTQAANADTAVEE
ncbi:MAG: YesL family protein [Lachnospiraceae bacterium]|nr:YesL family protein [Lachnospiraceae bacterium]